MIISELTTQFLTNFFSSSILSFSPKSKELETEFQEAISKLTKSPENEEEQLQQLKLRFHLYELIMGYRAQATLCPPKEMKQFRTEQTTQLLQSTKDNLSTNDSVNSSISLSTLTNSDGKQQLLFSFILLFPEIYPFKIDSSSLLTTSSHSSLQSKNFSLFFRQFKNYCYLYGDGKKIEKKFQELSNHSLNDGDDFKEDLNRFQPFFKMIQEDDLSSLNKSQKKEWSAMKSKGLLPQFFSIATDEITPIQEETSFQEGQEEEKEEIKEANEIHETVVESSSPSFHPPLHETELNEKETTDENSEYEEPKKSPQKRAKKRKSSQQTQEEPYSRLNPYPMRKKTAKLTKEEIWECYFAQLLYYKDLHKTYNVPIMETVFDDTGNEFKLGKWLQLEKEKMRKYVDSDPEKYEQFANLMAQGLWTESAATEQTEQTSSSSSSSSFLPPVNDKSIENLPDKSLPSEKTDPSDNHKKDIPKPEKSRGIAPKNKPEKRQIIQVDSSQQSSLSNYHNNQTTRSEKK